MTGGNIPILALKRMLQHFLKIPPLKQIFSFQVSRLKKRLRNFYLKENCKWETKSIIEKVQDELYQLEKKQAKGSSLRANIRWGATMAQELFWKYFKEKIWKTKQYLSYILMIINENILAILNVLWRWLYSRILKQLFKWTSFRHFRCLWLLGKAWHHRCYLKNRNHIFHI